MSADRSRVLKRCTEILNLCTAGAYSATLSTRNKTRNATAIADAVDAAGISILKAIAERPNEFRSQFATDQAITTSPVQLDAHIGPPIRVSIVPYSGATAIEVNQPTDYGKVTSYRENPGKVYDRLDHNVSGSSLSGKWGVWNDKFAFTGYSATVTLARPPVMADTLTLIPEFMEPVWVRLGLGEMAKVGTGGYEMAIIDRHGTKGERDLEEFKAGNRVFSEVDSPEMPNEVHTITK